ncbi:L-threonate dehydrogenase [Edwardsiella piscicida]|uniref:L-threonate dehydrogenase n=1 Tax=Edwardsiella piscicida TaxID=1263550 RepID=UPI000D512AE4|nr:L-threonate dehydrogenase [Edwardsiella piscicida]UCQ33122.1 NAD(P)-dependent oxidoreductase [Edwardsiella piscicida]
MATTTAYRVGVVGLGAMGMGAARACIDAGLITYGADIDPDARQTLLQYGGRDVAASAVDFAAQLDAALILVVNGAQAKGVLLGENGLARHLRPGTAVMLSTTLSAADAREIATALAAYDLETLDAPVSGGALKARAGELTVMVAGSQQAFARLQPLLDAIASTVYPLGDDIGQGATVKIIHQLLAGVHIAAAAEAMALAARAGIPLEQMYQIVTHAAGNSWMFEDRMRHVVAGDYRPRSAVDIFVKDLTLVAETASALRFPLPLASTALTMFTAASSAGLGREDDSAVIKIFAGIPLPGVDAKEAP